MIECRPMLEMEMELGKIKNDRDLGFGIGNGRDGTGYIKTGKSHQDATVESSRDGKITNRDPPDPYYRTIKNKNWPGKMIRWFYRKIPGKSLQK